MVANADDDRLQIDEETEINWRQYIADFREQVWPVFQGQGFTFADAFHVWMANRLHNAITDLLDALEADNT